MNEHLSDERIAEIEQLAMLGVPNLDDGISTISIKRGQAIRDLLAERKILLEQLSEHEQFVELLDGAGIKMNGHGMVESLATIGEIAKGKMDHQQESET